VADVLKTYVVPWFLSSDLPGPSCVVPFTGLSPKPKISVPWNQMTTNLIPIKIKPKCVMMYIIGIIDFLGVQNWKANDNKTLVVFLMGFQPTPPKVTHPKTVVIRDLLSTNNHIYWVLSIRLLKGSPSK